VENPVEYQMPGINQIHVNPLINMTFATALRTIVRQDPDIIMVGEIRDFETADIAGNAALTGHLVFSTLHTNDAPGALVRLLDMGIQPFLTSSAVIGVVAQRLVRVICPECKEFYTPSDEERNFLRLPDGVTELARGKGCDYCLNTGYYGRTGIFEIFEMDEDVRKLVLAQAPSTEIKDMTLSKGMKSLSESGREKVIEKVSTVDDLRRVIYTGKD
jgi:type II secretory ATPase GspE/PulE/Tfp pilus assembly ATPase PilB-like protein